MCLGQRKSGKIFFNEDTNMKNRKGGKRNITGRRSALETTGANLNEYVKSSLTLGSKYARRVKLKRPFRCFRIRTMMFRVGTKGTVKTRARVEIRAEIGRRQLHPSCHRILGSGNLFGSSVKRHFDTGDRYKLTPITTQNFDIST